MKFYTGVEKGLKLKVRKFLGLVPTFVEVTGEKLVGCGGRGVGELFGPPFLNRVKLQPKLSEFVMQIQTYYTNRLLQNLT